MLGTLFFDNSQLPDSQCYVARLGTPAVNSSPPAHPFQGDLALPLVGARLHWSADPHVSVLHMSCLATTSEVIPIGGMGAEDSFAAHKWTIAFTSEAVACSVTQLFDGNAPSDIIRVVWVSAGSLHAEVLHFKVRRMTDSTQSLVVEAFGTPKATKPFEACRNVFGGSPSHLQGAILPWTSGSGGAAVRVVLTNGHSLWAVASDRDGEVTERCIYRTHHVNGSHLSGSDLNQSRSRWGNWWQRAAPGTDSGAATPAVAEQHRVLAVSAIPRHSEASGVFDGEHVAVLLSNATIVAWHVGGLLSAVSLDTGSAPTTIATFPASDLVPSQMALLNVQITSKSALLLTTAKPLQATSHVAPETLWIHSVRLGVGIHAVRPVCVLTAPTVQSYVKSLCCSSHVASHGGEVDTIHALWEGAAEDDAPWSAMGMICASNQDQGLQMTLQRVEVNRSVAHQRLPTCNVRTCISRAAALDQLCVLGSLQAECVVAHRYTESSRSMSYLLSPPHHQQDVVWFQTLTSVVEPLTFSQGVSLPLATPHAVLIFTEGEGVTCNESMVESNPAHRLVHMGLEVIASHDEGCQTFANLISDAASNVALMTTLSGFHELAAAAALFTSNDTRRASDEDADAMCRIAAAALKCDGTESPTSAESDDDDVVPPPAIHPSTVEPSQVNIASRLALQSAVGSRLLIRMLRVMSGYVAWVSLGGHSHPKHLTVERMTHDALALLCGSLHVVNALGPDTVIVAGGELGDDVAEDVIGSLLNFDRKDPTLHALEIAHVLLQQGTQGSWKACAFWHRSLVRQLPVLEHIRIVQLLESSRAVSSAEVSHLSRVVSNGMRSLPLTEIMPILELLVESLGCAEWNVSLELGGDFIQTRDHAGLLYRSALLRRLVPRSCIPSSLLSPDTAAHTFLPELLCLRQAIHSMFPESNVSVVARGLTCLVADVYILLARMALDDEDPNACCRWLSVALRESPEVALEPAQRTLILLSDRLLSAQAAPATTTSAVSTLLDNWSLGDSVILCALTRALVGAVQRCLQAHRKTRSHLLIMSSTTTVYRFLVKFHAYGQAARLAADVAVSLRQSHELHSSILLDIEMLWGLCVSALEAITDVEAASPQALPAPSMRADAIHFSKAASPTSDEPLAFPLPSSSSTSSVRDLSCHARLLGKGSISNHPALHRGFLPVATRKLLEATAEYYISAHGHSVDAVDVSFLEDAELNSAASTEHSNRLIKTLISFRCFPLARQLAGLHGPTCEALAVQPVYVLQCEGVDLLDDPTHKAFMLRCRTDEERASSVFCNIQRRWATFIDTCVAYSRCEDQYQVLRSVLQVLLMRNYRLVPNALKQALRARCPNGLVAILLQVCEPIGDKSLGVNRVPPSIAEEIFDVAASVVANGSLENAVTTEYLTDAVMHGVIALKKQVLSIGSHASPADAAAVAAAQRMQL